MREESKTCWGRRKICVDGYCEMGLDVIPKDNSNDEVLKHIYTFNSPETIAMLDWKQTTDNFNRYHPMIYIIQWLIVEG